MKIFLLVFLILFIQCAVAEESQTCTGKVSENGTDLDVSWKVQYEYDSLNVVLVDKAFSIKGKIDSQGNMIFKNDLYSLTFRPAPSKAKFLYSIFGSHKVKGKFKKIAGLIPCK